MRVTGIHGTKKRAPYHNGRWEMFGTDCSMKSFHYLLQLPAALCVQANVLVLTPTACFVQGALRRDTLLQCCVTSSMWWQSSWLATFSISSSSFSVWTEFTRKSSNHLREMPLVTHVLISSEQVGTHGIIECKKLSENAHRATVLILSEQASAKIRLKTSTVPLHASRALPAPTRLCCTRFPPCWRTHALQLSHQGP
jgi:hypothetical protein